MSQKSLNKVQLIGTVGRDPETKYIPSGTAVAKFSLAMNERYKDKSGQWADKTEWSDIVCWAKLAEIVGQYVKKGGRVYVEGKLSTSSWEKDGQKRYKTEIVASDIIMLGGVPQNGTERAEQTSEEEVAIPF